MLEIAHPWNVAFWPPVLAPPTLTVEGPSLQPFSGTVLTTGRLGDKRRFAWVRLDRTSQHTDLATQLGFLKVASVNSAGDTNLLDDNGASAAQAGAQASHGSSHSEDDVADLRLVLWGPAPRWHWRWGPDLGDRRLICSWVNTLRPRTDGMDTKDDD